VCVCAVCVLCAVCVCCEFVCVCVCCEFVCLRAVRCVCVCDVCSVCVCCVCAVCVSVCVYILWNTLPVNELGNFPSKLGTVRKRVRKVISEME
jgi:hypothetical protein